MPSPTLPTGTVSGGSNGTRTFPIRDAPRLERVRDAPSMTDGSGETREPQSVHEELAHLRRENRELRRALQETRKQRQDVIDRYERLLDAAEPDGGSETPPARGFETDTPPQSSEMAATPFAVRLSDAFESGVRSLRRRYRTWIREANL